MAPPRQRTTAIVDDSRSEASSGTREYQKATKSRRPAAAKEKAPVTSAPVVDHHQHAEEQPRLPWTEIPLDILHSYRHVHKLPTPSAFSSDYSRMILSQGVGLRSPTSLAARRAQSTSSQNHFNSHSHRTHTSSDSLSDSNSTLRHTVGQDRVSKDQFALVVRKHFNSAGLSEQETIARFLYTVREDRRGRQFRLRFQP